MSFILDALKKSETDRQQRSSAEFAGVPTSSERAAAPRWLWALGVLLAINLVVLVGLLLRSSDAPATSASTGLTDIQSAARNAPVRSVAAEDEANRDDPARFEAPDGDTSFAAQVARAKQNRPPPGNSEVTGPETPPAATFEPEAPVVTTNVAALPTIYEVITDGTLVLPELHLDIHVYSDAPEDRFVFINMSKQREQSRLSEGPIVKEITPNGVVLEYNDTSFLLPRE